jgi:hypothetical protein
VFNLLQGAINAILLLYVHHVFKSTISIQDQIHAKLAGLQAQAAMHVMPATIVLLVTIVTT